jgi:hypothetical protein
MGEIEAKTKRNRKFKDLAGNVKRNLKREREEEGKRRGRG